MELESSVGRRAGRDSRNRISDQKIVQELLNRIPEDRGGAGGKLNVRMVEGMCTDTLHAAILNFQRKNELKVIDGRVDPDGRTFELLQRLAGETMLRSAAAMVRDGWTAVKAAAKERQAADNAERRRAWRALRDKISGLKDDPHRASALAYLDSLEAANPDGPVVPAPVIFGTAALSGPGYPVLWETVDPGLTKANYERVRATPHHAKVLQRPVRIQTWENDRALVLFEDSFVSMPPNTTLGIFNDGAWARGTPRDPWDHESDAARREKLREALKKLDGAR